MSRRRNGARRRRTRRTRIWIWLGALACVAVLCALGFSTSSAPPTIEELGFQPVKSTASTLSMYMEAFAGEINVGNYDDDRGIRDIAARYEAIRKELSGRGVGIPTVGVDPLTVIDNINCAVNPALVNDGWWWMAGMAHPTPSVFRLSAGCSKITHAKKGRLTSTVGNPTDYSVFLVEGVEPLGSNGYTFKNKTALFPATIRNDQYLGKVVRGEDMSDPILSQLDPLVKDYIRRQWRDSEDLGDWILADVLRYVEAHELQHVRDQEVMAEAANPAHPMNVRGAIQVLIEARGYLAAIARSGVEYGAYAQLALNALSPDMNESAAGAAMAKDLLGTRADWTREDLKSRTTELLAQTDPVIRVIWEHRSEADPFQYAMPMLEKIMKK